MRKISFLVLVGILAFSLESCSSMSKSDNKSAGTIVTEVEVGTKQANKAQKEEKEPLTPEVEEFKEVEAEKTVTGLIPATQPEIRVRGSIRGRQDPFAVVAIKPEIEIIEQEESEIEKSESSAIERPEDLESIPTIDEELSVAELADNVLITGLIELGDRIQLIVQAPEETSTRYVEVGQYLSNGQILVKRIEPGFPSPTVILEENGIEVAKVVGQVEGGISEEVSLGSDSFEEESITDSLSWLSN
ncbi:MAG: hypothetical protein AAGA80_28585 [Cyanobacteria bacterium P01_F01_bin.143]